MLWLPPAGWRSDAGQTETSPWISSKDSAVQLCECSSVLQLSCHTCVKSTRTWSENCALYLEEALQASLWKLLAGCN